LRSSHRERRLVLANIVDRAGAGQDATERSARARSASVPRHIPPIFN
jgi:hypothetical protein